LFEDKQWAAVLFGVNIFAWKRLETQVISFFWGIKRLKECD
jgi:hypothetical protein